MGYAPRRTIIPRSTMNIVAAAQAQPTLARLAALAQRSNQLLIELRVHVPPPIRGLVQAGPIDDESWCLIAANSAVAAKLRQVVPTLLQGAQQRGLQVKSLRIKVATQRLI